MNSILKTYQKKLTNLTANNRSLVLHKLSVANDFNLTELDYVQGQTSFEILEKIICANKPIKIAPYIDSRDADNNELSKKLRNISRKQQFVFDELGANDLYICYPFVTGQFNDGSVVRCPLIFYPISIQINDFKHWEICKRIDEPPVFNHSFLLAYAHFNKVSVDIESFEAFFENDFDDLLTFRNELYQFLKKSSLEINFNQDLYLNKIQAFYNYKKGEIELHYGVGQLKLIPEALIGFFQQSGSVISADYDSIIEKSNFNTFSDWFDSLNSDKIKLIKEENIFTPFKIDAYQENALRKLAEGTSLVVQGPPGTGKSQLICNVISDMIAKRKRVLVICQKKVALDVIYERLQMAGLQHFCTVVHDFKTDRRRVFDALLNQIEQLEAYQNANNSLDAIYLERSFLQISREIDALTSELNEFKDALFENSKYGISVKEMYLNCSIADKNYQNNEIIKNLDKTKLDNLITKLNEIVAYRIILNDYDSNYWNSIDYSNFGTFDRIKILEILKNAPTVFYNHSQKLNTVGFEVSYVEIMTINSHNLELNRFNDFCKDNNAVDIATYVFNHEKPEVALNQLIKKIKGILVLFEKGAKYDKIELLCSKLKKIEYALSQMNIFYTHFYFKWISKKGKEVITILKEYNLTFQISELSNLSQHLNQSIKLSEQIDYFFDRYGLDIYESNSKEKFSIYLSKCIELQEFMNNSIFFNSIDIVFKRHLDIWIFKLNDFVGVINEFNLDYIQWNKYFEVKVIEQFLEKSNLTKITSLFNLHFDTIVAYHQLVKNLNSSERTLLNQLVHTNPNEWCNQIQNQAYLSWIEDVEHKHPVLQKVSTPAFNNLENKLQKLIAEKEKLANEIVLIKARENTYKNLEFNRLRNQITYRDLKHQVTKKKKIWPLRKLIQTHYEEVTDLLPVWLASPETVSAIFDIDAKFDLVVFDEASQCFVEKAIPAIYRAQQIMIVGDDKQLMPNDLYKPRWEDESDETPETEIDSLLNLADKFLPQVMLCEHYRSKYPELIRFSNQEFYKNKLRLIPEAIQEAKAIQFVKVDGIWHNNSNLTEAEEIIRQIEIHQNAFPDKEIGVVTFNMQQQILIENLIESKIQKQHWKKPKNLFIKNIENVQGDERDIIMFSVGYARDKAGKLNLQFGLLNLVGGENRLNVAVTRAKDKIVIVTSILPEELKVENTLHEGPKILRKYLAYARNVSEGKSDKIDVQNHVFGNSWYLKNKMIANYESEYLISEYSDLKLASEENNLVFTDDDIFFSSPSIKDWFAYLPVSLVNKKWKVSRLYSRNFWLGKTFE
ncbi:MAG: AAA domain-containing protein [Bacteroidota bacterium]|nr:AAA domain-containing protein [Bacteroidota bacterium]